MAEKGAPVFISVMGLINVLTLSPIYWPEEIDQTKHFRKLWQTGDDDLWRGNSYCHFFRESELRELITQAGGKNVITAGLEGMALLKKETNRLVKNPTAWKNWLDCHYQMCLDPTVADSSGHMLAICNNSNFTRNQVKKNLELINRLAGSVKIPKHLRGKPIDEIIEES